MPAPDDNPGCRPRRVERQPLKKLAVDESALLKLLHRWREEAEKAGRRVSTPRC